MRFHAHHRLIGLLAALGGLLWLVAAGRAVQATPGPLAVDLIYFRATGVSNGVKLTWETGSELNTAGFYVQRADGGDPNNIPPSSAFVTLTQFGPTGTGFIPGEGSVTVGALYEEVDTTAALNTGYWYKLLELETSQALNELSVKYAVAGATPTATPQSLATATPRSTAATATPVPSSTATASPTSTGTVQATATTASGGRVTVTPTAVLPTATTAATTSPVNQLRPTAVPTTGPVAVAEAAGQTNPETAANQDNGYPAAPTPETAVTTAAQPVDPDNYPGGVSPNPTPVGASPIGSGANGNGNSLPPPADAPVAQADEGSNTLLLWIGFAGALLIFAGGVFGSIVLFSRQQQK